jgi:hypothetical protein
MLNGIGSVVGGRILGEPRKPFVCLGVVDNVITYQQSHHTAHHIRLFYLFIYYLFFFFSLF